MPHSQRNALANVHARAIAVRDSLVFTGLKVGMTMSMIGVIVGESISGQEGLGYVIMFASSAGESAPLYAALLLLAVLGFGLYGRRVRGNGRSALVRRAFRFRRLRLTATFAPTL